MDTKLSVFMKEYLFSCFLIKTLISFKSYMPQILIAFAILLGACTRDPSIEPKEENWIENNQMVVYPNSGNKLTIVDYNTFRVVKQIEVAIPDSFRIHRMCLSTNKDYFIFCASSGPPQYSNYIISYDIAKDSVQNIFPTGLDSVGAPRLTAAYIPDQSGQIYLYSHNVGLYSINFLTKYVNMISSEHGQSLGKHFYFTVDKKLVAILKKFGSDPAHSEIEFYNTVSALESILFVLNQDNQDSIQVDDLVFSEDNKKIFISIRLSQMRGIANYFGSYNLNTKELYKSSLTFPWSLNSYYMAYSAKRNEVYMVGARDKFYVIDTSSKDYIIKTVIDLVGKLPSPSRILISPDENVAFVSCVYSNFVIVIDLENKRILKTINIEAPYLMILL